jgi:hypothetical protein
MFTAEKDVQLVNEISDKVAKKLMDDHQLRLAGVGSQMMDQIKMIALSFSYSSPVDLEKARELLLVATDELVNAVNVDERIRPYLDNYPFEPKNVEIRIFLKNADGSLPSPEKLSVISALDGVFDYEVDDPRKSVLFTIVHTETYQEAKQKHKRSIAKASEIKKI